PRPLPRRFVRSFFSSRGRHTSFSRDWSSDVCSSDLAAQNLVGFQRLDIRDLIVGVFDDRQPERNRCTLQDQRYDLSYEFVEPLQIGRASCRGTVSYLPGAGKHPPAAAENGMTGALAG